MGLGEACFVGKSSTAFATDLNAKVETFEGVVIFLHQVNLANSAISNEDIKVFDGKFLVHVRMIPELLFIVFTPSEAYAF